MRNFVRYAIVAADFLPTRLNPFTRQNDSRAGERTKRYGLVKIAQFRPNLIF